MCETLSLKMQWFNLLLLLTALLQVANQVLRYR